MTAGAQTKIEIHPFATIPERGDYKAPRCLGTRSHCYCCLDPIPPTEQSTMAAAEHPSGITYTRGDMDIISFFFFFAPPPPPPLPSATDMGGEAAGAYRGKGVSWRLV